MKHLLGIVLIFFSGACFAITPADKGRDENTNIAVQSNSDGCSVTNSGEGYLSRQCPGGQMEVFIFTEYCTVDAASCSPADLYEAGIQSGACATIKAQKTARLQSQFLPPCDGPGGGGQP